MEQVLNKSEIKTDLSQLSRFFKDSYKNEADFQVGIEFEKLGVNNKTFQAVPYSGSKGIEKFLKVFKKDQKLNQTLEDGNLIGLDGDTGLITLEPGSQMEYSSIPCKTLSDIEKKVVFYNQKTAELGEKFGIDWIGYGIQPLSTFETIEVLPKKRYGIMTSYLPTRGSRSMVMMRETAGIQTAIDYGSEEDAMQKLKVGLGILPIITAMLANSPIRGGKLTGYKSYRSYAWLHTDNDRCGLISKNIFEDKFSFDDYVNIMLDIPMFFIKREEKYINATSLTFRDFINHGLDGHYATIDDWITHTTTFFPDIRLKNFLEIRNCDCQRSDQIMTFPAIIKGIMYNKDAMEQAWELVSSLSWQERLELGENIPKYALDSTVKNYKVLDLAKELVNIAEQSLLSSADTRHEAIYLENIKQLLSDGCSPADIIIKNWEGSWNQDLSKLINYLKIQ